MVRVAVAGARGKLGNTAHAAFSNDANVEYAGGFAREAEPGNAILDSFDALLAREPDVLFDATTMPASFELTMEAAARGIRPVIGASGWNAEQRAELGSALEEAGIGGLLVPNFSLGAVLMMRFAQEAACYFPNAEIVEMHRASKKDKPSGTALETAARIKRGGGDAAAIHSVRLPGLLAHQEVLFGGAGELLTIRHDSTSYESFVRGMLLAVRAVMQLDGLVVGLDAVMSSWE